MEIAEQSNADAVAKWVGWSLLATIIVGVLAAVFVVSDIDINLSADVAAVADSMLEAEQRLRAKAYIALLTFGLDVLIAVGLFLILRSAGPLLAGWSLFVGLSASILVLLGAVFALNAAELAGDRAYDAMTGDTRLMLASLQATSDYTSFHLGLILGSLAKAGFFYLFLKSRLIPAIIAGWGLFASLFVAFTIVTRDFVPLLGHGTITAAFMISNLIALVSTGLYLAIWGVRSR
ncbi:MAG: DUF4386 domain-containing protein [Parasphingopyxis sp.]|uniref:DUF4386 domain-containing protein n=1 Tax=Parasphingopyxis sp. TaxID=1920299 RepID=UPI003F9EFBCE